MRALLRLQREPGEQAVEVICRRPGWTAQIFGRVASAASPWVLVGAAGAVMVTVRRRRRRRRVIEKGVSSVHRGAATTRQSAWSGFVSNRRSTESNAAIPCCRLPAQLSARRGAIHRTSASISLGRLRRQRTPESYRAIFGRDQLATA
jgi:hypothetical protein